MKTVMTVAGSDSGGGAGIQADLKTFAAFKVYGTTAITALTAQNTCGVEGVHNVPSAFVEKQMEAVLKDMQVHAVKTGMLANGEIIEAVARTCRKWGVTGLVVDPVMVAKSGDMLLEEEAVKILKEEMLPMASVITPNLNEVETLLQEKITTLEQMKRAAREIHRMGPDCVVVKGGHLEGDEAVDLLFDGSREYYSRVPRVKTSNNHGTGCTYAAALAALLAREKEVKEAFHEAHEYVHLCLQQGCNPGRGTGSLHHLSPFYMEWG